MVKSPGSGVQKALEGDVLDSFLDELAWIQKVEKPGKHDESLLAAPDFDIAIGARVYSVIGRTVLVDSKSRESWQFFFGLTLAKAF